MNNIDLFNYLMFMNGEDILRCKICEKLVSKSDSISFRGINCICDKCREKFSNTLLISSEELMPKIQKAGEKMLEQYLTYYRIKEAVDNA